MANESLEQSNEEELKDYVERMATLQKSMTEIQKEMSRLTNDAKINGLDVDALRHLIQVRHQNPRDLGHATLTNLVTYAHLTGTSLEVVVEKESPDAIPPRPVLPDLTASDEDEKGTSPVGLLVKGTWGVLVAITLLWLLA